jgi:hypothetical protein
MSVTEISGAKKATTKMRKSDSFPTQVALSLPPVMEGEITAHAIIRSRKELDELREWIRETKPSEGDIIRKLYKGFDGLPSYEASDDVALVGEAAFDEVIEGPLNAYLMPHLVDHYFKTFNISGRKN